MKKIFLTSVAAAAMTLAMATPTIADEKRMTPEEKYAPEVTAGGFFQGNTNVVWHYVIMKTLDGGVIRVKCRFLFDPSGTVEQCNTRLITAPRPPKTAAR